MLVSCTNELGFPAPRAFKGARFGGHLADTKRASTTQAPAPSKICRFRKRLRVRNFAHNRGAVKLLVLPI
jgi:hypothetical protein